MELSHHGKGGSAVADRLTKALLADQIARGVNRCLSAFASSSPPRGTNRREVNCWNPEGDTSLLLADFKTRADSPTSKQHAVDMEELTQG